MQSKDAQKESPTAKIAIEARAIFSENKNNTRKDENVNKTMPNPGKTILSSRS